MFLLWRRSTWLQHLLQPELDPGFVLVLTDGQVVGQVGVAHQGGEGVPEHGDHLDEALPVLVDGPLKLGGVGVPRAHVLGLQVLHLGEDVEPARVSTHPGWLAL